MTIRKKILLYFSAISIGLLSVAFFIIYTLFSEYREEEFQKRQKEKIEITLNFLSETQEIEDRIIQAMDRITINALHDEKLLIFNGDKKLIYSSIDDTPIPFSRELLEKLSQEHRWVETKDGDYDVVGVYIENNGNAYYGVNKAYDTFGYSKLTFLKYALIGTFLTISLIIILVSIFVSYRISKPLSEFSSRIVHYTFGKSFQTITVSSSTKEIEILSTQFNALMSRLNESYSFQKNAINHISHELKTPIAILVSNFDRMEKESDLSKLKTLLEDQKVDTRQLGEIVNSLLELTKVETNKELKIESIRVDELLFDTIEDIKKVYSQFNFQLEYADDLDESALIVGINYSLIKIVLTNLLINCIRYSSENSACISIISIDNALQITFKNVGPIIPLEEQKWLFEHFFRGSNSRGKRGFGLGLVFVYKVMNLHRGNVRYSTQNDSVNIFTIEFPLS